MTLHLPKIPDLPQLVDQLLAQIPRGRLTTYGDLAEALGNRVAARWVGYYLMRHQHDDNCNCHRVVSVTGEAGNYIEGGPPAKLRRLAEEGLVVQQGRLPLEGLRIKQLQSPRPLRQLLDWQARMSKEVRIESPTCEPEVVGGVDICYPEPDRAIAAFALVEAVTGKLVWSTTVEDRVGFPYISTYLTFRELPVLLRLVKKVRAAGKLPEIVMVDGSGLLHPRRAGLACGLGVVGDVATIAVAKKLLCGQVVNQHLRRGETSAVVHEGEVVGTARINRLGSFRPLYVSPGHRTDVPFAQALAARLTTEHHLPEPLFQADRLGKLAR